MTAPMTPERLAEIRDRHRPHRLCDDCTYGRPCHARDLLAEVDRLTAPPTHEERQHGLSDGHSESYCRGWRMGRALATGAQAEVQRLGTEADALAQRAREAEAERARLRAQVAAERLIAWLHRRWAWEYGECDHGTYTGGPSHDEPYAMCERWGTALAAALASGEEEKTEVVDLVAALRSSVEAAKKRRAEASAHEHRHVIEVAEPEKQPPPGFTVYACECGDQVAVDDQGYPEHVEPWPNPTFWT